MTKAFNGEFLAIFGGFSNLPTLIIFIQTGDGITFLFSIYIFFSSEQIEMEIQVRISSDMDTEISPPGGMS